jgi:acetyltransferase-like isoleucine patch superfamily enzyme
VITSARIACFCRVGWTVLTIVVVQAVVCGAAVFPVLLTWVLLWGKPEDPSVRVAVYSLMVVPSYIAFAMLLMVISPLATWLTGARTPGNAELRLAEMGWPLMRWARYLVAIHLVRLFAGHLFRGSLLWTAYLRLNGARIGRRVYVNTLSISDHNLLELGDDVVIGEDAHISGHTVEAGVLKTGRVRLGRNVTVGLGSVIDIDVDIGAGCQVGALSLVPKHTRLEANGVYAGIPARALRH